MRSEIWDKYDILNLPEDETLMCTIPWAREENIVIAFDKHSDAYIKYGDHKIKCYNTGNKLPITKRGHRVISR